MAQFEAARQKRMQNAVASSLHEATKEPTRVAIEPHPKDPNQYLIALPVGDSPDQREQGVYLKIAVKPENPAAWRRATESQIQCSLSDKVAEKACAQDPVAGLFGDFFIDYNSRNGAKGTALNNEPELRKHYDLQALGSFAPTNKVLEACWVFPTVPKSALMIDYMPIKDNTARPVYVKGPRGHLYPADFGRGITQYWAQHPSGDHSKAVYVVQKPEIPGWVPERPKYLGGILWQVPDWMVRRFGPMGVKTIDLEKDEVEYYVDSDSNHKGARTLAATISEARGRQSLSDANLEESRRQQRLALLDLQEDYPIFLKDLLDDHEIAATRTYMDRIEADDAKERNAQINAHSGVPAAAAASERVNSELLSRDVWKEQVERARQSRAPKDPRSYPLSYSSTK